MAWDQETIDRFMHAGMKVGSNMGGGMGSEFFSLAPEYPPSESPAPHKMNPWGWNPQTAENPYSSGISDAQAQASQDQSSMMAAQTALPGAMAGMQSQMAQAQNLDAQYPSFPNSMGLGTQTGYHEAPKQAPSAGVPGVSPWMLSGEALSR